MKRLKKVLSLFCCASLIIFSNFVDEAHASAIGEGEMVHVILTTADQANKLTPQSNVSFSGGNSTQLTTITVNENSQYQQIDGIGASIPGSSAWLLMNKMSKTQRDNFMTSIFDPTNGIGISMLRQPFGGTDQNAPNQPMSYDDNGGSADPNLTNFNMSYDTNNNIIGLLNQAKQLNPSLKVLGSVWSYPHWMLSGIGIFKTLNSSYYSAAANYLDRCVSQYAAQGIPVWGLTIQNEPLYSYANFGDNLTANQENNFIKHNLGPLFSANGRTTKIIAYDHNFDHPEYPEKILGDSTTSQYVAGTAWHYYAGDYTAMTTVQEKFPSKGTYYTEASGPSSNNNWSTFPQDAQGANSIFDIFRNWARTYTQWTLLSNTNYGPGSCKACGADAYVDESTGNVTYSYSYYMLGHFSKYVMPGAYRIKSSDYLSGNLRSVAFKNPDGSKVLEVFNGTSSSSAFGVNWGSEHFDYTLPSYGLATFVWSGAQSTDYPSIPGVIQAEEYDHSYGIQTQACSEGGLNVGYCDVGDWMDYTVNVPASGVYSVNLRVASRNGSSNCIQLKDGSTVLATVSAPNTGDWQNWTTVTSSVSLNSGRQTLRVYVNNSGWNLNWIDIEPGSTQISITNPNFETGDISG